MTNASFFTTECEFQPCNSASRLAGAKAEALWVDVVATCHRGLGYSRSLLDTTIKITSREYVHLVVRYPADQQLILVMLVTRGLASGARLFAEQATFLLVLAKSRWYSRTDALIPYGSPASN